LPASQKTYQAGRIFPDIRVPMRAIALAPSGRESAVRVYDSSGSYTDPAAMIAIEKGLPRIREMLAYGPQ